MSVTPKLKSAFVLSLFLALGACGGGGSGSSSDGGGTNDEIPGGNGDGSGDSGDPTDGSGDGTAEPEPLPEGAPTVTFDSTVKQLTLNWDEHERDAYYKVSENPGDASGFTVIEPRIEGTRQTTMDVAVHQLDWPSASYVVESCDSNDDCISSAQSSPQDAMLGAIGYFKASNPDGMRPAAEGEEEGRSEGDEFGQSLAISDDGKTLVVGAHNEESNSAEDQSNNSVRSAGAAYVYTRGDTHTSWQQEAYLKAPAIALDDDFGHSVALSGDGNVIAVGAPWDEDTSMGPEGDTGLVYVFTKADGAWSEPVVLHASTLRAQGHFGHSLSLSDNGDVLVVGASGYSGSGTAHSEDGTTDETATDGTTTDGTEGQTDTTANASGPVPGAAYVFVRGENGEWVEQAILSGDATDYGDEFGYDVAVSGDGSTVIVGASAETVESSAHAGAAYVYARSADTQEWQEQGRLQATSVAQDAAFGHAVALSDDGSRAAVGAAGANSDVTGAVYVFSRDGSTWANGERLAASNEQAGDAFGADVAFSDDGNLLAVGAPEEDSGSAGINGSDGNASDMWNVGAVYLFNYADNAWQAGNYVKPSNPNVTEFTDGIRYSMHFGHSVALDETGFTMAVGAIGESSASAGFSADQTDRTAPHAGAVYLY